MLQDVLKKSSEASPAQGAGRDPADRLPRFHPPGLQVLGDELWAILKVNTLQGIRIPKFDFIFGIRICHLRMEKK